MNAVFISYQYYNSADKVGGFWFLTEMNSKPESSLDRRDLLKQKWPLNLLEAPPPAGLKLKVELSLGVNHLTFLIGLKYKTTDVFKMSARDLTAVKCIFIFL